MAKDHPNPPHAQVEAVLLHCVLLRRDGPIEDAEHGPCHDVSQGEAGLLVQGGLVACKAPVPADVHERGKAQDITVKYR